MTETHRYERTREYGWAPLPVRRTPTAALTLAVVSYLPGLGILAIPALILAATTGADWEHPVTRYRARRATTVAIISIALNILAVLLLIGSGVAEQVVNR